MKPEGPVARRADYDVTGVDHASAADMIKAYHYARGCAGTSTVRHGLRRCVDGVLVGAALWMPPTAGAAKALAARLLADEARHREVLVLSRLVVAPNMPANAAGLLLGGSTREVWRDSRWNLLVTYADTSEGHVGTIYRATGWVFDGETEPQPRYTVDGRMVARKATRSRTHAEMLALGATRTSTVKLRFYKVRMRSAPQTRQRPLWVVA